MSATPSTSALKALHPDLRRRLQRLDSLERQAQQARASRWRAPPAPGRDSDSWLVTYLDLVTLLLVMLVVLLGLSRMPSGQVDVTTGAALAAASADPAISADNTTASALAPAPSRQDAQAASTEEASTDGASAASVQGDARGAAADAADGNATAPVAVADAPAATAAIGATLPADTRPTDAELAAAATTSDTPAAVSVASGADSAGALAPGATLNHDVSRQPAAGTATPSEVADVTENGATAAAPAFPALALVEDGPWVGTRLRLPDPSQPSRWSLPGFAAIAEQTPPPVAEPPAAPAPEPPSIDGLGLGELGEGIDVIVNEQSVSFRISNEILFPSGQADLAMGGSEVLDRLANVLARNPYPLSVEGHTDIIPIQNDRFPSNWELATARATSVVRYLSHHGIASDRMRAVGYAHTRPLATNDTPQGRSTNRRVELIMEIPPAR